MYRIRRFPPPLNVTLPPPSSTTRLLVFRTFAVAFITIVTAVAPQANRITPPLATAATTAADVQLAGVPFPTTRSARDVSTALPSTGTTARPEGFPGPATAPSAPTGTARPARTMTITTAPRLIRTPAMLLRRFRHITPFRIFITSKASSVDPAAGRLASGYDTGVGL
ncbi:hypothetical protein ABGB17_14830 [Sphaerisporangium sp. B11E5]|uniref:hypothetical protein n=1 Tax=Sphaerisporangium sp. B11E5 TaxID=3153563 RepID=UPI00325CADB0